jgi:hypothetical protein
MFFALMSLTRNSTGELLSLSSTVIVLDVQRPPATRIKIQAQATENRKTAEKTKGTSQSGLSQS